MSAGQRHRPRPFEIGKFLNKEGYQQGQKNITAFENTLNEENISSANLGEVTSSSINMYGEDWNDIGFWKEKYDNAIGKLMGK